MHAVLFKYCKQLVIDQQIIREYKANDTHISERETAKES